jgi:hypothetical protein
MGRVVIGRVVCGASFPWGEWPWGELSMGRVVHGASCPWGELSMGRVVAGASCPWGELSRGQVVHGRVVLGRILMGRVVRGASGPGTGVIAYRRITGKRSGFTTTCLQYSSHHCEGRLAGFLYLVGLRCLIPSVHVLYCKARMCFLPLM